MPDLGELQRHEGELVCLRFTDGQVVWARLLGVDVVEHEDIMYETVEATYIAAIADLQSWSSAETEPGEGAV